MTMQSMTGFSRHSGELDGVNWLWEIKSVNGKGLDLRFRTPAGFEAVETQARKLVSAKLGRGNLQVTLQVNFQNKKSQPVINHDAVRALAADASTLAGEIGAQAPSLAELLSIRGVVEFEETGLDEDAQADLNTAILDSFADVLDQLVLARGEEGEAMASILTEQLANIETLVNAIEEDEERSPEAIRERLSRQVERLLSASEGLDAQRLHQEASLLAAKADIQEELDRLKVHVASVNTLLNENGPVGRKLDFIAQEFNRECNTICSKSNSANVSSLGLDMKLVIDQFREQVQNVE